MIDLTSNRDPSWQSQHTVPSARLAGVREWLLDEASLTEYLINASGGAFAVQRLNQSWQVPLPSERRMLQMTTREQALVREVALLCHDRAWVFARSVIPAASLTGPLRHLRTLNNQSLGALLFRDPRLGRGPFQIAHLPGGHAYIHPDLRQAEPAWARRSRFELHGKSLLVSEVFLQPFCQAHQSG